MATLNPRQDKEHATTAEQKAASGQQSDVLWKTLRKDKMAAKDWGKCRI